MTSMRLLLVHPVGLSPLVGRVAWGRALAVDIEAIDVARAGVIGVALS